MSKPSYIISGAILSRQNIAWFMRLVPRISKYDTLSENTGFKKLENFLKKLLGFSIKLPFLTGQLYESEIDDISCFTEPNKLVAFVCVDPSVKQSGEFVGTQNKISKRGSPNFHRAIWMSPTIAAFHDPIISDFYQNKRSEGKHHRSAIGACARKLTLIIYAVLRDNKPYVPNC